jgi:hypothetical protein
LKWKVKLIKGDDNWNFSDNFFDCPFL